ncbi:hypothetical protein I5L01_01730 [Erythrobacter sp. YJ-T3-07]|uniref:hypothetical protein n=1 Tax=Erythrobacter sp. YJ-T3-07 TaxID=2793063 RepID=UPI0018D37770|nr:hypothetical protein [Erythrobacter sp. YJ-T3-07]MBH1942942.1 hypothetical protein [Erythrobacter sp. YJ-T3-07]
MERRGFLTGLGLVGFAPLALHPASLLAARAVPQGEFRLERVLRRDLFDGKAIIVNRGWLIRFDAAGGGVEVTGEQVTSVVEAPPELAALARLEEQRTASLLPLRLSASGTIVDQPGDSRLDPLPNTVIEAAADYVAGHSSAPAVDLNVREFVAQLSQRQMGWLSRLPPDLLFPAPRDRTATREVALADGGQGRVELREKAQADRASGLLDSFVREAITTVGESSRSAAETWRLYDAVS